MSTCIVSKWRVDTLTGNNTVHGYSIKYENRGCGSGVSIVADCNGRWTCWRWEGQEGKRASGQWSMKPITRKSENSSPQSSITNFALLHARARQEHFNTDRREAPEPRWACWQRAVCRRPRERRAPSRPSQPPSTPPSSRRSCQPACRTPARKRSKCEPTARKPLSVHLISLGKYTPLLVSKFS